MGVNIISDNVDLDWDYDLQGKFDIIIMRHVLEHFMDPLQVLKKVRKALFTSGMVYIAVPNNLKPTQNLRKNWFRNVHTYYFNKYSLKNMADKANLKIVKLVEGDIYNKGELFLLAKTDSDEALSIFSKEHYLIQMAIFKKRLDERILFYINLLYFQKGFFKK